MAVTITKKPTQPDLFEGEGSILAPPKKIFAGGGLIVPSSQAKDESYKVKLPHIFLSPTKVVSDDGVTEFTYAPKETKTYVKPPPPKNNPQVFLTPEISMIGKTLDVIDHVWIAKSAIQKAYRRGDQTLFDYSFNLLVANNELDWLIRRALIFPAEENWPQVYPVGRLLNHIITPMMKNGSHTDAAITLKNYLRQQATFVKNKAADGIRATADYLVNMAPTAASKYVEEYLKPKISNIEMILLQQMMEIEHSFKQGAKSIDKDLWEELWRAVDEIAPKGCEEPNLILRDQVGACYFRSKYGGMASDKTLLICVCLLSLDDWKLGIQNHFPTKEVIPFGSIEKGYDVLTELGWPWWACDMHTKQGKIAISAAAKKFGFPPNIIKATWFYEESAICNTTTLGSYWWEIAKNTSYYSKGYSIPEAENIWHTVRPFVKKIVESMVN